MLFFFFNGPPTTEIYTLSLLDALPILTAPDFAELRSPVQAFTGRDWQRCVLSHRLQGRHIAGSDRFLDPADVVLLDMAGDLAGLNGREPAVHLDHYLRTGTCHRSNRLDQVERPVKLGAFKFHVTIEIGRAHV